MINTSDLEFRPRGQITSSPVYDSVKGLFHRTVEGTSRSWGQYIRTSRSEIEFWPRGQTTSSPGPDSVKTPFHRAVEGTFRRWGRHDLGPRTRTSRSNLEFRPRVQTSRGSFFGWYRISIFTKFLSSSCSSRFLDLSRYRNNVQVCIFFENKSG